MLHGSIPKGCPKSNPWEVGRHCWRPAPENIRRSDVHLERANTQTTPPCGTSACHPINSLMSFCWKAASTPKTKPPAVVSREPHIVEPEYRFRQARLPVLMS